MDTPSAAAIYCRLSRDPDGTKPNVADQERRCRELAARKGWAVGSVFVDRDRTAAGRDPFRPAYEELCQAIKSGEVDAILALDQDRLVREPHELEQLLRLCEDRGLTQVATAEGDLDLSSSRDIFTARIKAAVSADEVANIKRRTRRAMERMAQAGELTGGGHRPFGFEEDRITIRADEALIIKDAVKRLLAGTPLRAIVNEWRRDVPTVAGGTWSQYGIKRLLSSPRLIGRINHKGEPAGKAPWPALISEEDHAALRALLWDPARTPERRSLPRRYFLRGLLFCGQCQSKMIGKPNARGNVYTCPPRKEGGCGGVAMLADPSEAAVANTAIAHLADGGISELLQDGTDENEELVEQLRVYRERLDRLSVEHVVEGYLSRAAYLEAKQKLEARIEEVSRLLSQREGARLLAGLPKDADALKAIWDGQGAEWRHALLKACLVKITVHKAARGANRFDPDRCELTWRS